MRDSIACPLTEICRHLMDVVPAARSAWAQIMTAHGYPLIAARSSELIICPAVLLEYVSGTHFGSTGGQALTEHSRSSAPSLFKLLKFSNVIDTLDFGSLTWRPDSRSTALEAILARLAISPDGAQRMLASETGSLRELYAPCFATLKKLNKTSPVTEHMASPPEAPPAEPAPTAAQ